MLLLLSNNGEPATPTEADICRCTNKNVYGAILKLQIKKKIINNKLKKKILNF